MKPIPVRNSRRRAVKRIKGLKRAGQRRAVKLSSSKSARRIAVKAGRLKQRIKERSFTIPEPMLKTRGGVYVPKAPDKISLAKPSKAKNLTIEYYNFKRNKHGRLMLSKSTGKPFIKLAKYDTRYESLYCRVKKGRKIIANKISVKTIGVPQGLFERNIVNIIAAETAKKNEKMVIDKPLEYSELSKKYDRKTGLYRVKKSKINIERRIVSSGRKTIKEQYVYKTTPKFSQSKILDSKIGLNGLLDTRKYKNVALKVEMTLLKKPVGMLGEVKLRFTTNNLSERVKRYAKRSKAFRELTKSVRKTEGKDWRVALMLLWELRRQANRNQWHFSARTFRPGSSYKHKTMSNFAVNVEVTKTLK